MSLWERSFKILCDIGYISIAKILAMFQIIVALIVQSKMIQIKAVTQTMMDMQQEEEIDVGCLYNEKSDYDFDVGQLMSFKTCFLFLSGSHLNKLIKYPYVPFLDDSGRCKLHRPIPAKRNIYPGYSLTISAQYPFLGAFSPGWEMCLTLPRKSHCVITSSYHFEMCVASLILTSESNFGGALFYF